MNFANAMQAAMGLQVTSRQFLETETVSNIALSCAAQEKNELLTNIGCDKEAAKLNKVVAEFGINAETATTLNPESLEAIVGWFLDEIWLSPLDCPFGFDNIADWAMFVVTESSGVEVARIVGKAADAIEGRLQCRYGTEVTKEQISRMQEFLHSGD